ncbi:hypothetical protein ABZ611_01305 [Streptomyces sp. NPDC007861]|uniref:hypothetical protein n=1 Tax=Streptomyces sp. NPDC007861 TaxID=3154893 RepID=UPI0033EC8EAA
MLAATIRWECRFVRTAPVLRFSCVSDLDAYQDLLANPTPAAEWYLPPVDGLDASSAGVFELVGVAVNGKPQKARPSIRKEGQVFTCSLGCYMKTDEAVTVWYAYRLLVQQGRALLLYLAQPTKDFRAELWYGDCGIRRVSALDYPSGPRHPQYAQLAASDPSPSVEVAYVEWTFLRAAWRSCGCWSGRCARAPVDRSDHKQSRVAAIYSLFLPWA